MFHTYDGLSQQQKQRVWQQIASQRHAIFDSVDATLSVVEDLRRLPAHAIAVFLSRDDFTWVAGIGAPYR